MRRIAGISIFLVVLAGTMVWAAPTQQADLFQLFILEARTDLEQLANEALGEGVRPESWTFNTDLESNTVVVDLWFDHEQLADDVFGTGQRPPDWFGATSRDREILARNIRHDMELTADDVFGVNERPESWNGAPRIYRCDRTLQNFVRLGAEFYDTRFDIPQGVIDYCATVVQEISETLLPRVFEDVAPQEDELAALTLAVRGDLERLANELFGVNERPSRWVGNVDVESPSLAADLATDLELLANERLGSGNRPDGWGLFVQTAPAYTARILRFNLEALTDETLGVDVRPNGWQSEDPLDGCLPLQQGLVVVAERNFGFMTDETLATSADFCELTLFTANTVVEDPPIPIAEDDIETDTRFVGESNFAFSYLDVAALQYMGVMPQGTEFRAWYRNFSESTMMFVSGENFALFIDRRFTTLPEEIFASLPTLDGVRPLTFCDANWCNGPGPTPTPTGSGPLQALIFDATPPATIVADEAAVEAGKTSVSWNNIRVTYLLDRPEAGTVQVALEICAEPQQIACEPVSRVFDNTTGTDKPVLSQFNGLNVYEFRYGFNDQVVVEGPTRIASAIFLSDPTIR